MRTERIAGNLFLGAYFWVTFCAFLYTVFHIPLFFPYEPVRYAYGMMAPYQGFSRERGEILAEGRLPDGSWEVIDLSPYYPVIPGERNLREVWWMWGGRSGDREADRVRYARTLLTLERAKGNAYEAVRVSWQRWPSMTGGYRDLKVPAFTQTELLADYEDVD